MPATAVILLYVIGGFVGLIAVALIITSAIFDLPAQVRKFRHRSAARALREMKYFNILLR